MVENKEKLDHVINFRSTEKIYNTLMDYLEQTNKSISGVMRQATYDFLKLKKMIKENGYGKSEPLKKKKQEAVINAPPDGIMFCDSEHCEIDPRQMEKC